MENFAILKISLACSAGAALVSCAASMQQPLNDLRSSGTTVPKAISGPLLNKCTDKYKKWQNATFPEGATATYSEAGVNLVAMHHPPGPNASYSVENLASYRIAISHNWLDPASSYAYCYYKSSNGKLEFLDSMETNGYGDMSVVYVYNVSADIFEKLTGRRISIRY